MRPTPCCRAPGWGGSARHGRTVRPGSLHSVACSVESTGSGGNSDSSRSGCMRRATPRDLARPRRGLARGRLHADGPQDARVPARRRFDQAAALHAHAAGRTGSARCVPRRARDGREGDGMSGWRFIPRGLPRAGGLAVPARCGAQAALLETGVRSRGPRVRIPPPPLGPVWLEIFTILYQLIGIGILVQVPARHRVHHGPHGLTCRVIAALARLGHPGGR
jgi:hypothetical protein